MLVSRARAAFALAVITGACTGDESGSPPPGTTAEQPPTSRVESLGVDPANFECESIASEEEVASIVGADITLSRSEFNPPRGVARACIYSVGRYRGGDAGPEARNWSIDFDCRKSALDDGERLIAQVATKEAANPVRIGRSGVDREPALIFIDEEAPCYVRVVGPDSELRAELARHVAGELTAKRAPMTPIYRRAGDSPP